MTSLVGVGVFSRFFEFQWKPIKSLSPDRAKSGWPDFGRVGSEGHITDAKTSKFWLLIIFWNYPGFFDALNSDFRDLLDELLNLVVTPQKRKKILFLQVIFRLLIINRSSLTKSRNITSFIVFQLKVGLLCRIIRTCTISKKCFWCIILHNLWLIWLVHFRLERLMALRITSLRRYFAYLAVDLEKRSIVYFYK